MVPPLETERPDVTVTEGGFRLGDPGGDYISYQGVLRTQNQLRAQWVDIVIFYPHDFL